MNARNLCIFNSDGVLGNDTLGSEQDLKNAVNDALVFD